MIRNIKDLARHLGAYEDTSESIARRIYKDTACGCSSQVFTGQTGTRQTTYTVRTQVSIAGWRVQTWREHGSLKLWAHKTPIPKGLADYLLVGEHRPGLSPTLCAEGLDRGEMREQFGREWMETLQLDEHLVRKTKSGPLTYYLTLRINEPTMGEVFSVSGYCEGSDRDHQEYVVPLPCTPEQIDEAISAANEDGEQTWDETHGCPECQPEGYCDEWGNEWTPEDDNWIGQPINPDCASCEGAGVVI